MGHWPEDLLADLDPSHQLALDDDRNPVLASAEFVYKHANLIQLNPQGITAAAKYIHRRMQAESHSPSTWRAQPLHLIPPMPYDPSHPGTKATLDWIFFISAMNFSFWSEREDTFGRYAVQWKRGWSEEYRNTSAMYTGYWSLVAAVNRALEEGIPITDPTFFGDPSRCSDALIEHIFRADPSALETIPLLSDRITVLRQTGSILIAKFGGSYQGFLRAFNRRFLGKGTALDAVKMVVETFPCFRDEVTYQGRKVCFWKRPQILIGETWAAFHPPPSDPTPHPLFPRGVHQLTMFPDYRVPQIMHRLRILTYPPSLIDLLRSHKPLPPASEIEVVIRAAGVIGVEKVRQEINDLRRKDREAGVEGVDGAGGAEVSSVLIDFWLWDLAKAIEKGEVIEGIEIDEIVPAHRTRSIWY